MVWLSLLPPALIMSVVVLPLVPGLPTWAGVVIGSIVNVAFVVWVGLPVAGRIRAALISRRRNR